MASQIYTTGTSGDSRLFYQDPTGSYKQIADTNQLQDLAKAGTVQVGGTRGVLSQEALAQINGTAPTTQQATAPTQNVMPGATSSPASPSNVGSLEVSPGTYSSSALIDYYNKELERNRPQYEQAQGTLSGLNQRLQQIYGGPSLQETYNQQLTSATSALDQQLLTTTNELKGIDTALAGVEQEVRARIGQGQAPEAYIQAEIARQSTPLINQRNAIANSLNALQEQRQNALQGVQQSMQYFEADRNRQLSLLDAQRQLAQQTVDSFNTLAEKGRAATDQERDNARQLFSQFLTNAPDFLTALDEKEIAQLQQGVIPYSAMSKLGKTIAQQKLEASGKEKEATKQQILAEANRIIDQASQQGEVIDFGSALNQAKQRYAAVYGFESLSGIDFANNGVQFSDTGMFSETPDLTMPSSGDDLGSFMSAIAKQESGGRYNAIGPKTSKGQQAYGKYQVMDFNIPSWTKAALGKSMTPQQFLNDPQAQEAVAEYQFTNLYNKYGNWGDVASVWFSGRPLSKAGNAADVTGTTVPKYVNNILAMMGQPSSRQPNVQNLNQPNQMSTFNMPDQTEMAAGTFVTKRSPDSGKFTPQFYATKLGQKIADNEMQAMTRFQGNKVYNDFYTLTDNASSMKAILDSGTSGPADIALVYNFMKVLDPSSVVRETEFDAAAKSGNIFQGALAKYNGYFSPEGGFLPENVKNEFIKIMNAKMKEKTKQYNSTARQFRDTAKNQGMNPDNIALEYDFVPFDERGSSNSGMDSLNLGIGESGQTDTLQLNLSPSTSTINKYVPKLGGGISW